jgi:hypothetical protein
MPRRWQRTSGGFMHGRPRAQLISMITLLIVLVLIYARARDPMTWRWLAADAAADSDVPQPRTGNARSPDPSHAATPTDTLVPGPTDRDPEELEAVEKLFAALSDKAPLAPAEMPAYWRLMQWARAQSFDNLARRAKRDTPFAQLFEQPDKYRGKLLRLRLHVKRILEYEAPKNTAGVERVYEAWGWTEDSKSYPYVVVFSELPPGMHVGTDVQEEGVFVGYFLKTMSYVAFDKSRAAPLLVGRIRSLDRPAARPARSGNQAWFWGAGGAIVLLIGARLWIGLSRHKRQRANDSAGGNDPAIEDWLSQPSPNAPPAAGSTTPGPTTD